MDELKTIIDEHAQRITRLREQYRMLRSVDCYDESPSTFNAAKKLLDELIDAESDWITLLSIDDKCKDYAQKKRKAEEARHGRE